MTPNEASRELARAVTIIRSTGWRIALWRASVLGTVLLAIVPAAIWVPDAWLNRPGSLLPMVSGAIGLVAIGAAGLAAGASIRAYQLRRRVAEIENARGLARGELLGALELGEERVNSVGLANLHRARMARALEGRTVRELLPGSHRNLRAARRLALPGVGVALAVTAVGIIERPVAVSSALSVLARPWAVTFPPPPPPLRLSPPGGKVMRGGGFDVVITAVGRSRVRLGHARPGTPPRSSSLEVEDGVALGRVGPIDETIRLWAEDDLGSVTDTFVVIPLDPLTITDLQIEMEYPRYLRRAREVLTGPITLLQVPSGTQLGLTARMNHPVDRMGLARDGEAGVDSVVFDVTADLAKGTLTATDSALLSWWVVPEKGVPGIRMPPAISLSVRVDAAPTVVLAYPGEDRDLGVDQTLPLIIEATDDYGLAEVGLVWWRESAGDRREPAVFESLAEGAGARRLVVRPIVDLEGSGFLPGDEIVYFATASDSQPGAPASVSDTFRARLSGFVELKREVTRRAEDLAEEARSLGERAGELSNGARDAARRSAGRSEDSRQRDATADRADFGTTSEARDLLGEAHEVEEELRRIHEELRDVRTGLEASSFVNPEMERRMGELEELYREILESGLREKIDALEAALRGLDRDALQAALSDLSRQTADLEERLDRALGLMERVALEQSLEGARQTAEDLANRQRLASEDDRTDEAWADGQDELAAESEELARQVDALSDRIEAQQTPEAVEKGRQAADEARSAASRMRSAAREAGGGAGRADSRSAHEARSAAVEMERAERSLAAAGQSMTEDWRSEAMRAVGRATSEALDLAKEQERIVERLRSGDRPEDVSSSQSAVREGLDNLSQSLAEAGRQTVLLDRRTGPAAAQAGREMDAMRQSISGGAARRNEAVQLGESAMQALSDLAGALLASGRAMAEASSATGMEEALERLAGMGERQAGMNSETGELFLLLQGGRPIEARLRDLAARQEGIAGDLRDLAAEPAARDMGIRPEDLAGEADEIARRLMTQVLDDETLSRQERLFQRLLDAGRSLERDEDDESRREATTARPRVAVLPAEDARIMTGPRYPYPDESHMQGLTASQRRLVYEYFDRLNREIAEDVP